MARVHHWADALSEQHRLNAWSLICLARGCGMAPGEVRRAIGKWFNRTGGGDLVYADPTRDGRFVACRPDYRPHLTEVLARRDAAAPLFRPERRKLDSVNAVSNWTSRFPIPELGRLDARRLRSTWIVEMMRLPIDRDIIATAAGMRGVAQLEKYRPWVPEMGREDIISALTMAGSC